MKRFWNWLTRRRRMSFSEMPSFGMWVDRTETDEEILAELGSGWRGFAVEDDTTSHVQYLNESDSSFQTIRQSE